MPLMHAHEAWPQSRVLATHSSVHITSEQFGAADAGMHWVAWQQIDATHSESALH